jgi:hypothetical protein
MPDVRRDNNGIAFTQLRFAVAGGSVFDSTLNHNQRFRAVGVVMTTVRVAWLQDAPANRHIVTVTEGPVRKPSEITPAEFLALRFALRENLNVVGHGNGFLTEGNEGNEGKKLEDLVYRAPEEPFEEQRSGDRHWPPGFSLGQAADRRTASQSTTAALSGRMS